ncbi:Clavaminate synthase-like protein [Russula ochroleuca]|uniref:Clavaminate synthase-like protein n=1 Tax=Russula ochroleuca TaxID=152965 RepID=A0A9P5TC56_9AGAM|nr:Clavaminate synthase-like protein [Russula ochroleuca]
MPRSREYGIPGRDEPILLDVHSDHQTFRIPLIDLSKYRHADSLSEKRKTADEIVNGFKEVGFIYLEGHGIPSTTSAAFFSLSSSIKDKLAWEDPRANRGYVKIGRERVTQSEDAAEIAELPNQAPDMKETMEIGRDWDKTWRNHWPRESDVLGFKQTMLDFYQMFFEDKINEQRHNLRLVSYPSIKTSLLMKEGQARAGAHSDYGTLALLFQDNVGGLEVENPRTKRFQPATPMPGTIVVNTGDLLARWSNDILRSTLHRVVAPPAESAANTDGNGSGMTPLRQSIVFFCSPNGDARISCLPNCERPTKPPSAITTEEYIVGRLASTI